MARKRNQLPSMTQLRKILSKAAFDPRVSGPLSIITAQNSPSYYESRAIEMIGEARLALGIGVKPNDIQISQYNIKIEQAVALLALAIATREKDKG